MSLISADNHEQNQDPVVGQYKPLLGIDAWEHVSSISTSYNDRLLMILQAY